MIIIIFKLYYFRSMGDGQDPPSDVDKYCWVYEEISWNCYLYCAPEIF